MTEQFNFGSSPSGRFFIKMQGLQNHFVITDSRVESYSPGEVEIRRICDPRIGVGADQLVIIEAPTSSGAQGGATAFMRILNVDGREVEACGNATRCIAWLLMEESGADEIVIETLAGLIDCKRVGDQAVSCSMGRVSDDWRVVPLAEARDTHQVDLGIQALGNAVTLNVGNPHAVFFVDDPSVVDLQAIAPGIQKSALFPNEVNVGIAKMISSDHLQLTVYERGAGLTMACGSGACAAVRAAQLRGLTTENKMTVTMPAGDMSIEILADAVAVMSGPVEYCFAGFY